MVQDVETMLEVYHLLTSQSVLESVEEKKSKSNSAAGQVVLGGSVLDLGAFLSFFLSIGLYND